MSHSIILLNLLVLFCSASSATHDPSVVSQWGKVTISFHGPVVSELSDPNPFTDYLLTVTFTHLSSKQRIQVPGFFAADGDAAHTSAQSGNIWQVRFSPSRLGTYRYVASFRKGPMVVTGPNVGDATAFDGESGTFNVITREYPENDLRGKGRLQYIGQRYFRYSNGEYKLKLGTNTPENFLGYAGFDGNDAKLTYESHVKDWKAGDPVWGQDARGREIIGVINYLASQKVNSLFAILLTVKGDSHGQVHPWLSKDHRKRYDVSKLEQWNIVFEYAARKGLSLNLAFLETENEALFEHDEGLSTTTGFAPSRKIFYRELVARFAHNVGFTMTLGEENGWSETFKNGGGRPWGAGNTHYQRQEFSRFIRKLDPYNSPIALHTYPNMKKEIYGPMLGGASGVYIESASLQMSKKRQTHRETKEWIAKSINAGLPWVVSADEIGADYKGAPGGVTIGSMGMLNESFRAEFCWGNLLGGGAGVEVFAAPVDQSLNDFREFHAAWKEFSRPLQLFEKHHIPFWAMNSIDHLVKATRQLGPSEWLFAFGNVGDVYVIYRSGDFKFSVNLAGVQGEFVVRWFDPRGGKTLDLQKGGNDMVVGGKRETDVGHAPRKSKSDWVVVLSRQFPLNNRASKAAAVSPLDLVPDALKLRTA